MIRNGELFIAIRANPHTRTGIQKKMLHTVSEMGMKEPQQHRTRRDNSAARFSQPHVGRFAHKKEPRWSLKRANGEETVQLDGENIGQCNANAHTHSHTSACSSSLCSARGRRQFLCLAAVLAKPQGSCASPEQGCTNTHCRDAVVAAIDKQVRRFCDPCCVCPSDRRARISDRVQIDLANACSKRV